jgi:hypothetical protein
MVCTPFAYQFYHIDIQTSRMNHQDLRFTTTYENEVLIAG